MEKNYERKHHNSLANLDFNSKRNTQSMIDLGKQHFSMVPKSAVTPVHAARHQSIDVNQKSATILTIIQNVRQKSIETEIDQNFKGKDPNSMKRFTNKFSMALARKLM